MAKAVEIFQGGSRNCEDGKSSGRQPSVIQSVVRKRPADISEKLEQSLLRLHLK